jgi:hypothetical protein
MLEFSKHILKSVSFDRALFQKELSKMLTRLKPEEATLLVTWALATFGHMYGDMIHEAYKSIARV